MSVIGKCSFLSFLRGVVACDIIHADSALHELRGSSRELERARLETENLQLSDRLLSERMKELEARGIVERHVSAGTPVRVSYGLTDKGRELAPAMAELKAWADRWLD